MHLQRNLKLNIQNNHFFSELTIWAKIYVNALVIVCALCFPIHTLSEKVQYAQYFRSIGEELISLERSNSGACKSFLRKHSQNLHNNHYYLMDVKLALAQMIGANNSGATAEQENMKLSGLNVYQTTNLSTPFK